jgi:hypothetical protein
MKKQQDEQNVSEKLRDQMIEQLKQVNRTSEILESVIHTHHSNMQTLTLMVVNYIKTIEAKS